MIVGAESRAISRGRPSNLRRYTRSSGIIDDNLRVILYGPGWRITQKYTHTQGTQNQKKRERYGGRIPLGAKRFDHLAGAGTSYKMYIAIRSSSSQGRRPPVTSPSGPVCRVKKPSLSNATNGDLTTKWNYFELAYLEKTKNGSSDSWRP